MAGSRPSCHSTRLHQLYSSAPLAVSPLRGRTHPVNPPPVCLQLEACFAGTCDEPVLLAGCGSRPQSGFCLTEHAGCVSHSNFDPRLAPTVPYIGPWYNTSTQRILVKSRCQ